MDAGADLAAGLLGRDYWLIVSRPAQSTSRADIGAVAPAHLRWLLALEAEGRMNPIGEHADDLRQPRAARERRG
jgi:hypothetical protein